MLVNYSNTSIIFDNETNFDQNSMNEDTVNIKVDEKDNFFNITAKLKMSATQSKLGIFEVKGFLNSFVVEITKFLSDIHVNYDIEYMSMSGISGYVNPLEPSQLSLSIALILIIPLFEILELRESKKFLLMKISGVYESTIFLSHLVVDTILMVFVSLLISIMFYYRYRVEIFCTFFFLFFIVLYFYVFYLSVIPIVLISYYKIYFVTFVFILCAMPLIIIIFFAQGVNLMKLSPFLVIFPHWMLTMFLDNIMISYVYEIPFNFKNLVILTRWKNSWYFLLFTIALIVFYLLIYLILNVLLPRNDGAPQIGFSNILSLSAWKQIFNFKKSEYIENVNESFIEVTGIDKTYKGSMPVHALNDVSFTINKGDTVVLIGPNGSGKSTLLNAMTGSISSDQGVLRIYGCRCPSGFNALQDHLGICYQDNILFDKLSVYQHLELFATIRGVCCERVCEVVDECMSRFHLEGMDNMRSSKLSGGNKRKLCVVIAFIGSPKFVILDEPTSGMDTSMRQEMWKAISSYNITSIVSSHSVEEAGSLTNRIFVMRSGELLFDGSPNELRRKFHCGYRLTPIFYTDGDKRYRDVLLRWMQTNVQGAIISPIRDEDILFPICDDVTELLEELEQKLPIFRMRSFNIIVEQLESVLYRMFIDDEN